MLDIVLIVVTLALTAVALLYVAGCERLRPVDEQALVSA